MRDRKDRILGMTGIGVGALLLPLPFIGDLRQQVILYVLLSVAATLLLYIGLFLLRQSRPSIRGRDILLIALLLRAVVFPLRPSLSDDAWRYLWDGRLLASGINPYHYIPADTALAPFHDELFRLQGYPETNTIYPPVAQLIFASAVSLGAPLGSSPLIPYYIYKLMLVAADMGAIWLLLRLLARLRLPLSGAILYAFHPLVIVELAGQGHTDGFWVFSVALALFALLFRKPGRGLPGLAFGVGVRLFPVLLIPVWYGFIEKKDRLPGILLALPLLIPLYILADPEAFSRFSVVASRFTNYYEFNGGFYFAIKGVIDALKMTPSNAIAGAVTTGIMLLGVGAITFRPIRGRLLSSLIPRLLGIATLQIALSAKVHIWYFVLPLYLLALWPDRRLGLAWLWAALIAPMTYLFYAAEPFRERYWVVALEWGGVALLSCIGILREWKRREGKQNEKRPVHE